MLQMRQNLFFANHICMHNPVFLTYDRLSCYGNRVERPIAESPSHTTVQAMSHTAVSDLCLTKDVYMENKLFLSKYFKLRAW